MVAAGEADQRAAALAAHHGGGGPENGERALEVGGDDGVPLRLGHVEEHPLAQDAGHTHDAVDAPVPGEGRVDDALAARHGGDVVRDGDGLSARGLDLLHHAVGDLARRLAALDAHPVVVDDDLGALGGRGECHGPPDAPVSAGDGDDLACQEVPHVRPLPAFSDGPLDSMTSQMQSHKP